MGDEVNEDSSGPPSGRQQVVAPGWEPVRQTLEKSVADLGGGGSISVFRGEECLVDTWAGESATGIAWTAATRCLAWSASKGIAAATLIPLVEKGVVNLDEPIIKHWPEFGVNGKREITLRHLLCHTAGLAHLGSRRDLARWGEEWGWDDQERFEDALAGAAPLWAPGTRTGYHGLTFGWLIEGYIRRATGKSISEHVEEELNRPLRLQLSFGYAPGIPRVASTRPPILPEDEREQSAFLSRFDGPSDIARIIFAEGSDDMRRIHHTANSAAFLRAVQPAVNALVTTRDLAKLYTTIACGGSFGSVLLATADAVREHTKEHVSGLDAVVGVRVRRGLGFVLQANAETFGHSDLTIGHSGVGGQLAFADPDRGLGVAFVSNTMLLMDEEQDYRARALLDAVYTCSDSL